MKAIQNYFSSRLFLLMLLGKWGEDTGNNSRWINLGFNPCAKVASSLFGDKYRVNL
jgi:hypothetical protein